MADARPLPPSKRVAGKRSDNFTERERSIFVELICGRDRGDGQRDPPLVTVEQLAALACAPSARELYRYRQAAMKEREVPTTPVNRDFRSILAVEEKKVLCGFLLYRLKHGKVVSGAEVIDFIAAAYGRTVTKQWVSATMPTIGFSRHKPRARPLAFEGGKQLEDAVAFIREHKELFRRAHERKQLVAMDQITFWDNGLVTSCYAPVGG
jgi:hypothetical protein